MKQQRWWDVPGVLAETMQVARPNEQMLLRLAPPLPEWPNQPNRTEHA